MDRREALKRLAVLTGGALSFSTISGVLGGCRAESTDSALQTLSPDQNELVIQLSERIIPETETPGAKAAKVNHFIDHMLTNWNTKEEQEHFLKGLAYVDQLSNKQHSKKFIDLDKDAQISIMQHLEKEAKDTSDSKADNDLKPFFSMLKELTVVGYYTSEIGASQELNLDLIPGYYDACKPYSEVGRAWS